MCAAEPYTSEADAAPTLDTLVAYLKAQDTGRFLYRGQKREFPRPLVPRIFRGLLDPKDLYDSFCIPDFRSMRSLGKMFVGNYVKSLAEQSRAPGPVRSQKLLFERMLDVWGYLLGSTIAQHYGVGSGLLDATTDPSIAALFAAQRTAAEQNDCGVIYRFSRVDAGIDLSTLDDYSYWNAPGTIVPGELLASLEGDISLHDSWKTLRYSYEMFKACSGRRWNLLRIPKGTVANSRIGRQKAAFIVPDEFHLRLKEPQYSAGPIFGELRLGERPVVLQAIEDLSTRESMTQYYFRHSDSPLTCAPEEASLWPNETDQLLLTVAFVMSPVFSAIIDDSECISLDLASFSTGDGPTLMVDKSGLIDESKSWDDIGLTRYYMTCISDPAERLHYCIMKAGALLVRAYCAADAERLREAASLLEVGLGIDPDSIVLLLLKSMVHHDIGDHQAGAASFNQAFDIAVQESKDVTRAVETVQSIARRLGSLRWEDHLPRMVWEYYQSF